MKRLILVYLFSLQVVFLMGQQLYVRGFWMDENDLTAITAGSIVLDQSGQKCALIKIETTIDNLIVGTGSSAGEIIKTQQMIGELWVYVHEGLKRLTISHLFYGNLNDYDLGQSLEKGRTYVMQLETTSSDMVNSVNYGSVAISSTPNKADIFIDGLKVGTTPLFISQLMVGEHNYRISYSGFQDYVGKISIPDGESVQLSATLIPATDSGLDVGEQIRQISVGDVSFNMIRVDGGSFQMGELMKLEDYPIQKDLPDTIHQVFLSTYYIGETEVTCELWKAVMGEKYVDGEKGKLPVSCVSWNDCQKFIVKLNKITGLTFRLPTEAEWEFAARGGNRSHGYKYSGGNIVNDVAWYDVSHPHIVMTKKANELGLYDMSGNVYEWCQDYYDKYSSKVQYNPIGPEKGEKRVVRGGSWRYVKGGLGSVSKRTEMHPSPNKAQITRDNYGYIGFRLAL